jgi:FkbM family methyltransferase
MQPFQLMRRLCSDLRLFSRLLRFRDALRLVAGGDQSQAVISVFSTELGRPIALRRNTSDLDVVRKILSAHECAVDRAPSAKLVVDAGANIGISTAYFAKVYPEARIYAIEPEPSNFALLKRNCQALPNVVLQHAALWSSPTRLSIVDPSAAKWAFAVREDGAGAVRGVTVDELLRDSGQSRIDLLKLDIEGAEKALFSKGTELWLDKVGVILIELHDRYVPGCSRAFYSQVCQFDFEQEIKGENVIAYLKGRAAPQAGATETRLAGITCPLGENGRG